MDKHLTPRTYAAWQASIDGTGCVCRMEPIWETMERLEKENIILHQGINALGIRIDELKDKFRSK